jgi:hypothetical protein
VKDKLQMHERYDATETLKHRVFRQCFCHPLPAGRRGNVKSLKEENTSKQWLDHEKISLYLHLLITHHSLLIFARCRSLSFELVGGDEME